MQQLRLSLQGVRMQLLTTRTVNSTARATHDHTFSNRARARNCKTRDRVSVAYCGASVSEKLCGLTTEMY